MAASIRDPRERLLQTAWYEGVGLVVMAPIGSAVATVFDRLELGRAGRSACERPLDRRIHRMEPSQALAAELGLALLYAAWDCAFHCIYDRIRPVQTACRAH